MSFRRRALFLAGLFVAVSCSDAGNPIGPEGPRPEPQPQEVMQALTCTVSINDPEMRCAPPAPGTGGALGNVSIVGGTNGVFVKLTKLNHNFDADSMWFDVTLANYTGQTLGTVNGSTADVDSVRVFFLADPNPTAGGDVTVGHPAGAEPITTSAPQPYYEYPGMLADSAVSPSRRWHFDLDAGATTFTFQVMVRSKVQFPRGWLKIRPRDPVLQVGEVDTLEIRSRNRFGQDENENVTWSSSNPSVVSVTAVTLRSAQINAVGEGMAWVKAQSDSVVRVDSVLVTVNNTPVVQPDSISALENVTDSIPAPRLQDNVTAGGGAVIADTVPTWAGGEAIILSGGGLVYRAPAGFTGKDTVTYQVTDGTWTVPAKVVVQVEPSRYWYVRADASGDGRDRSPFGTIAAAQAVATAADSIFVLTPANGTSAVDGPAVLQASQALIGQGVTFDVTRTLNGQSVMVFDGTGAAPGLTRTAGATVVLAQNNVIRGVGISSVDAAAIHGVGFGTLTVGDVSVQAGGPALSLVNGDLAGSFTALHSLNSDSAGLTLQSVGGTLTATASSISGAATTGMSVTNGSVDISFPGAISHSGTGRVLDVNNHSGDATFQGAVTATAGTGALFNTASGAYTFNGAVTLSGMTGGFAGIDVRGGSTGTFSFPAGSSISNTSGPALYVGASAPTLTYAGTLSNNNNNAAVSRPLYVDGITGGTVTVSGAVSNTGAGILVEDNTGGVVEVSGNVDVSGSAGGGILVQNNSNGADIRFTGGTKHIHSTSNITGVNLVNNTGASITFAGGGLNIDMPSGSGATSSGFVATGGGTVTVTGANNVIDVLEGAVQIVNTTIGVAGINLRSVTSSPTIATRAVRLASTGAGGLQITGAGAVAGSGGSITSVDTAVSLSSVGGPVELAYLTVGTGTTVGVAANTFNTLTLTGASLTTAGGPVLNLTGGALAGTAFLSAPNSLTSGAVLTNVTGSLTATGGGMSVSAVAGAGPVLLVDGGSVSVSYTGGLTGIAATPLLRVANGHSGTLALNGTNSMITTGSPGLRFENADGTYNLNVTAGTTALSGDSAGVDILAGNDATNGSQGTFQFGAPGNGFAITSGAGTAFNFQGSAADVTFHGGITKNAAQTGRMVDITGQRAASAITFQTGTLSATSTNAASTGILLNDADGTVAFSGTTTLGSVGITTGDAGIDVENGSSGTITFAGTSSVVNAAGELIRIVSSAPTFTYPGTFQRTSGNAVGILAQNNTGGTITLNGDGTTLDGDPADVTKSLSTGTANAVSLLTNTGTTFHFAGGMVLASTSGTSFNATGGGTVNVSGAGNTANATAGTAVRITDTNIGATSGVVFRSVSAAGGTTGIVLSNTGNTGGGFGVMGDGATAGSGGTIQNTQTGASFTTARNIHLERMNFTSANTVDGGGICDGLSNSGCNGVVYLNGVVGVTLDRLALTGTIAQEGIVAQTVTNIAITNATIPNAGNEQWEHAIKLFDVLGTANSITGSTVSNAGNFNVFVQNSTSTNGVAGAADSLLIQSNTISNPGSALQSDGITVATRATGNLKVAVVNNTFNTVRMATDGVQVDAGGSSAAQAVVTGNSIAGYNTAINISGASTASNRFNIFSNPTLSSGVGHTINLAANGDANLRGFVKNNPSITTTSATGSSNGIDAIVDQTGSIIVDIDGNTISGIYTAGIRAGGRNATAQSDVTIRNNNVTASPAGATPPAGGIYIVAGNGTVGETNRTCLNLTNNQIVNGSPGAFDFDIYLENYNGGGFNNTFQLQGLTGSGSNQANVNSFLSSRDIGGARAQAFFTTGAETYVAATCATP